MQISVEQTTTVPNDIVFVEEFTVEMQEDGLHIFFKSPPFADLIKRFSGDSPGNKLVEIDSNTSAFDIKDKVCYFQSFNLDNISMNISDSLNPFSTSLVTRGRHIAANLGFLTIDGIREGLDLRVTHPVAIPHAVDYYHAALQGLQVIYADYIRPTIITSSMTESFTEQVPRGRQERG